MFVTHFLMQYLAQTRPTLGLGPGSATTKDNNNTSLSKNNQRLRPINHPSPPLRKFVYSPPHKGGCPVYLRGNFRHSFHVQRRWSPHNKRQKGSLHTQSGHVWFLDRQMPGWSYCSSRAAVHSKSSENTENHQYPLKTSLSGKWDCLGKHRCTVTLVVSLNSLVCMNCFEILRWDVLGKQNNYSKVQGSAFFLYPQIFFMSDFWLMAIVTSIYF